MKSPTATITECINKIHDLCKRLDTIIDKNKETKTGKEDDKCKKEKK